jgi:Skp family chaperone for outer membrane proteins
VSEHTSYVEELRERLNERVTRELADLQRSIAERLAKLDEDGLERQFSGVTAEEEQDEKHEREEIARLDAEARKTPPSGRRSESTLRWSYWKARGR